MGIPVIVAPSEAEGVYPPSLLFFLFFHLYTFIFILNNNENNASKCIAQCASLAREGAVYAAGSEDMDTLTFGGSVLYRHLTFSEAKKAPIMEVNLEKALEGLDMDMSTVSYRDFILFCFIPFFLCLVVYHYFFY